VVVTRDLFAVLELQRLVGSPYIRLEGAALTISCAIRKQNDFLLLCSRVRREDGCSRSNWYRIDIGCGCDLKTGGELGRVGHLCHVRPSRNRQWLTGERLNTL